MNSTGGRLTYNFQQGARRAEQLLKFPLGADGVEVARKGNQAREGGVEEARGKLSLGQSEASFNYGPMTKTALISANWQIQKRKLQNFEQDEKRMKRLWGKGARAGAGADRG